MVSNKQLFVFLKQLNGTAPVLVAQKGKRNLWERMTWVRAGAIPVAAHPVKEAYCFLQWPFLAYQRYVFFRRRPSLVSAALQDALLSDSAQLPQQVLGLLLITCGQARFGQRWEHGIENAVRVWRPDVDLL